MVLSDKRYQPSPLKQRAEVGEVAVEQFTDALVLLQTEVVVLRVGWRQADKAIHRQAEGIRPGTGTSPIHKEVRSSKSQGVKVSHFTDT